MAKMTVDDGAILSQRQLNRTLLARQHLLDRADMTAESMIVHLCGMQSQIPGEPFTALWTRLQHFTPDDLSRLMIERATVRASLMRGTIHLVTRDDFLTLQPMMRPLHERAIRHLASTREVPSDLVTAVLDAGRELLRSTPMTIKALGEALAERFPDQRPPQLGQVCRFGLALVQTTPRGVWGASHQATWALADEWLGTPVPDASTPEIVLQRYLAAFGPATIADMQAWCGLTGLRAAVMRMRPELRVYRNEQGQELYDLPDARIVGDDIPAPVRFLPEFDNVLLSHKDRTRIISDDRRTAISSINGRFQSIYLVDGFVAGTWRIASGDDGEALVLTPFEEHSAGVMEELEEEGRRLLAFLDDTGFQQVVFVPL